MSNPLRLVLFDVDGTLVDSQADILRSMDAAFAHAGLPAPDRADVLRIVGLSLPQAFAVLAPEVPEAGRDGMVEAYKSAYQKHRAETGAALSSPLYPGARDVLKVLGARDNVLIGVATGKSRRGLDLLIEAHDLSQVFATQQVADFHPSKPHPSMILTAMAETGVEARNTVMIGDTQFDRDMALAAGVAFVGVSWGYHPRELLTGAIDVLDRFEDLPALLDRHWEQPHV